MHTKFSLSICLGIIAGSMGMAASAQAFSFTTNFTKDLIGPNEARGDIWLNSVEFGGTTVSNFGLVDRVNILHNDLWTGGNSGAGSADRGDLAEGLVQELLIEEGAVTALGNLNLNNIIDVEDRGSFSMNVWFDQAVDNLFFWERGRNSAMRIQAIDDVGNSIGNLLTINSRNWNPAGFGLNTVEIEGTQPVGSLGVSLADLGLSSAIAGVRVSAEGTSLFNGPDWKVVGSAASVPEPGTVMGLGAIASGMLVSSRRKKSQKA
ncbi:exosortase-dependent surface protein XDP2 [Laspinema olomoucense]|uniref:exosortase-dependent surface protein XDP2 n=1 Tax=Laspinema olomoucense TaxID=3231600 RepID=UPI0021BA8B33|nr:exosortase-dependent surface protein XDP2 [Laspinema sp. D3d]MCT7974985.1 PEP-CTERM sorting domain-containing protein [Laspinema sp. D3d]